MILRSNECSGDRTGIGNKTIRLQELQLLGLPVPPFVAVPCDVVARVYADGTWDDATLLAVAREIQRCLRCDRYAVRSSALVEDAAQQSYAGQFRTQLPVDANGLVDAMRAVVAQAADFLQGDVSRFSLLVQEYVAADRAGVVFTRSPLGGRAMVIEYHEGAGEKVVGGMVTPQRLCILWTASVPPVADLPQLAAFLAQCKKIDAQYGQPQDIEWCVARGEWYFLQTRPITTLRAADVAAAHYLDASLPQTNPFLYEKTEIAEIAPRPCPLTIDLLRRVYSNSGPVARVYTRYGVRYRSRDFLRIIGNELYIDREEEIRTLLPAYSYLGTRFGTPHAARFSGAFTTLRNMWKLNTISPARSSAIIEQLQQRLHGEDSTARSASFSTLLDRFLTDYELIFEINLLAEKAVAHLMRAVQSMHINTVDALAMNVPEEYMPYHIDVDVADSGLIGNSFDIADESQCISRISNTTTTQNTAALDALPKIKKAYLQSVIARAQPQQWSVLREYGRLLTVQQISRLRSCVLSLAAEQRFSDARMIYFASLDELLRGTLSEEQCRARQQEYQQYHSFHLPDILSSVVMDESSTPVGVSAGVAQGTIMRAEDVRAHRGQQQQKGSMLYTDILSPDLASLLPEVAGIISRRGGMLSHLAIIARENHLPVIVNVSLAALDIAVGDTIEIDGSTGLIKKIEQ